MTYLAAVTTLRGEPPHNKNNPMSFVRSPRFHSAYTALGWMQERRVEKLGAGWDGGREGIRLKLQDLCDTEEKWNDIGKGHRGRWVKKCKG